MSVIFLMLLFCTCIYDAYRSLHTPHNSSIIGQMMDWNLSDLQICPLNYNQLFCRLYNNNLTI
jgi:hypothetical protein